MNEEFKGVWIPRELWLNSDLKLIEKTFLVEIASLDGVNGCYASNSYFSDFFDLSKTRCSAIIKTLQEKGYITIRRFYENGKKNLERRIIKVNKEIIKAKCDRTLREKFKGTKPKESEANVEIENVEFINKEVDELIDINQSNEELKEIECNKEVELGEEIKELDGSLETSQDNKELAVITYNEIYEVRVEGVTENLINSDKVTYLNFLVSRLCQIIDENIMIEKSTWNLGYLEKSLRLLFKESNTLFDDLFKNIENNLELQKYIYDIIFNGATKVFNKNNPLIDLGCLYGLFKEENNIVKISNRIYEQIIYDYFASKLENTILDIVNYNFRDNFLLDNGGLHMEKVLIKFQQFMKEQFSSKDIKFLENNGRTLFLAFLKPIINGVGFEFKEVQIAEEKRLDVVITYNNFKYIIELKIWRGQSYHEKGLNQLCDYLDIHGINKGYLLIFDFNENKKYKYENISVKDKELFQVYV